MIGIIIKVVFWLFIAYCAVIGLIMLIYGGVAKARHSITHVKCSYCGITIHNSQYAVHKKGCDERKKESDEMTELITGIPSAATLERRQEIQRLQSIVERE